MGRPRWGGWIIIFVPPLVLPPGVFVIHLGGGFLSFFSKKGLSNYLLFLTEVSFDAVILSTVHWQRLLGAELIGWRVSLHQDQLMIGFILELSSLSRMSYAFKSREDLQKFLYLPTGDMAVVYWKFSDFMILVWSRIFG